MGHAQHGAWLTKHPVTAKDEAEDGDDDNAVQGCCFEAHPTQSPPLGHSLLMCIPDVLISARRSGSHRGHSSLGPGSPCILHLVTPMCQAPAMRPASGIQFLGSWPKVVEEKWGTFQHSSIPVVLGTKELRVGGTLIAPSSSGHPAVVPHRLAGPPALTLTGACDIR